MKFVIFRKHHFTLHSSLLHFKSTRPALLVTGTQQSTHLPTRRVERTYVGCKEGKTCIASTYRQEHANTSLGTVRYHRLERAHRGVSSRLTVLQPSVGGRLVSYTSQYICYNCIIHYNIIKLYKYYNMDGML